MRPVRPGVVAVAGVVTVVAVAIGAAIYRDRPPVPVLVPTVAAGAPRPQLELSAPPPPEPPSDAFVAPTPTTIETAVEVVETQPTQALPSTLAVAAGSPAVVDGGMTARTAAAPVPAAASPQHTEQLDALTHEVKAMRVDAAAEREAQQAQEQRAEQQRQERDQVLGHLSSLESQLAAGNVDGVDNALAHASAKLGEEGAATLEQARAALVNKDLSTVRVLVDQLIAQAQGKQVQLPAIAPAPAPHVP